VPSVLFATETARSEGDVDEYMIVIKSSGYGPLYSIDTASTEAGGESVIVETGLSFKRDAQKIIISQNFEEFFCSSIRQAIREL
jgi:hypothetical protein